MPAGFVFEVEQEMRRPVSRQDLETLFASQVAPEKGRRVFFPPGRFLFDQQGEEVARLDNPGPGHRRQRIPFPPVAGQDHVISRQVPGQEKIGFYRTGIAEELPGL